MVFYFFFIYLYSISKLFLLNCKVNHFFLFRKTKQRQKRTSGVFAVNHLYITFLIIIIMVGSIYYHRNVKLKLWVDELPPAPSFREGEQCHLFVFFRCILSAFSVTYPRCVHIFYLKNNDAIKPYAVFLRHKIIKKRTYTKKHE